MTFLILALTAFLLYLIYERIALDRLRRQVPQVITVTGTRGKSSVVRLLASVLRESGRKVLAKTTGSQAQYVYPDGTIREVPRRGMVSILEQKATLRRAASLGVDCLVVEIMSVHPANHLVESHQILKPDTVLLTNVRLDHTEAMGETEEEIARVLGLDLVPGANVILPGEYQELLQSTAPSASKVKVHSSPAGAAASLASDIHRCGRTVLSGNYDLVTTAARTMGIADEVTTRGMNLAAYDIGEFKIWKYRTDGKELFVVNAFAANDPVSTKQLLGSTRKTLSGSAASFTGLLHLRSDRADRTMQWAGALTGSDGDMFDSLYVVGGHARALARKIKEASVLGSDDPREIMQFIASQVRDRAVVFGFGNIGGIGARLVEHWNGNGEAYGT
ncbi:MAG TPA: poly-gamma-glutamate synthase PgsB [Bacteroidetes bacterium]|nr:poly-gamma-glutamate synthase PgsB [Bacteroidota bacterium]